MTMDTGTGTSQNINSKSCVTPETWQAMVGNMGKQHEGCTIDQQKTAHGYTFTGTCKTSDGGTMVTSGSANIPDSEHIVSQSHTGSDHWRGQEADHGYEVHKHLPRGRLRSEIKPDEPETEDN